MIYGVDIGVVLDQLRRIGEAAVGVFGHGLGHGHGALHQLLDRVGLHVAGGNAGLLLADDDAQAQVLLLGTLQLLHLAQPLGVGKADGVGDQGVGLVGAGRLCLGNHILQQRESVFLGDGHEASFIGWVFLRYQVRLVDIEAGGGR